MLVSLKKWLSLATPKQKQTLADKAETSVATLAHLASGFRGGSARAAIRIAAASRRAAVPVGQENVPLPIDQASICPACKDCPHYKASNE